MLFLVYALIKKVFDKLVFPPNYELVFMPCIFLREMKSRRLCCLNDGKQG
jgi:hypothetical protein